MGYKKIHVIVKCERSEPDKLKLNFCVHKCYNWMRVKRAGKIQIELPRAEIFMKNLHFPHSSKLRSDYLFSFQTRTDYLFPGFSRSDYSFRISATPPPPQNQIVVSLWLLSKDWVRSLLFPLKLVCVFMQKIYIAKSIKLYESRLAVLCKSRVN